ncbi:MAG: DUF5615 family PIN-like protein [Fimbriimonadales bacterium]
MRFLVDAQLPYRLALWFRKQGYDVVHTLDLVNGNRTTDAEIKQLSLSERRVIVTKDADFVDNLILHGNIHRLLLVSTGNFRNSQLLSLFEQHLDLILKNLEDHIFVELTRRSVITHW